MPLVNGVPGERESTANRRGGERDAAVPCTRYRVPLTWLWMRFISESWLLDLSHKWCQMSRYQARLLRSIKRDSEIRHHLE